MKGKIKDILAGIGWYVNSDQRSELRQSVQDLLAIQALPELSLQYLPWTTAAIRPGAVQTLLNEIVIHQRSRVLEFGAGISTLYVADRFRSRGGRIVSVEQDREWATTVRTYLKRLEIPDKHYTIIHAPLTRVGIDGATNDWYDVDRLTGEMPDERFDVVFVDGPPACSEATKNKRYPALPFAEDYLQSDFVVFLDDVGRGGERQVAQKWMNEFDLTKASAAGMGVFRPPDTQATWDIV